MVEDLTDYGYILISPQHVHKTLEGLESKASNIGRYTVTLCKAKTYISLVYFCDQ